MKEFFFEAPYSDISFEVESQIIPAHKWLLTQRNKYFARLFSSKSYDFFGLKIKKVKCQKNKLQKLLSVISRLQRFEVYSFKIQPWITSRNSFIGIFV